MNKRKTILTLLCAMLLAFNGSLAAITLTDADIHYPIFPWRDYTLQLSLFSDDPEIVDSQQRNNILLKFESLAGGIFIKDINAYIAEFYLRTENGTEYKPEVLQVFIEDGTTADFSGQEKVKSFGLLYKLPENSWVNKLDLLIGEKSQSSRTLVRILPAKTGAGTQTKSEATQAPTATPTAGPTPEPTPEPIEKKTLLPGLSRVPSSTRGYMQAEDLAKQYGISLSESGVPMYTPKSPQPLNAYMVTHPECEVGINKDGMYMVSEKGLVNSITKYLTEWMGEIEEQSQGAIRFVENPDDADIIIVAKQSYFFHADYTGPGIFASGYGSKVTLKAKQLTADRNLASLEMKRTPAQTESVSGSGRFWKYPPELKDSTDLKEFVNEILSWYGYGVMPENQDFRVKALQQTLVQRGLLEQVSGTFDVQTIQAVKQLQASKEMEVTGEVDPLTLIALYYDGE